jgi:hypothetical protein
MPFNITATSGGFDEVTIMNAGIAVFDAITPIDLPGPWRVLAGIEAHPNDYQYHRTRREVYQYGLGWVEDYNVVTNEFYPSVIGEILSPVADGPQPDFAGAPPNFGGSTTYMVAHPLGNRWLEFDETLFPESGNSVDNRRAQVVLEIDAKKYIEQNPTATTMDVRLRGFWIDRWPYEENWNPAPYLTSGDKYYWSGSRRKTAGTNPVTVKIWVHQAEVDMTSDDDALYRTSSSPIVYEYTATITACSGNPYCFGGLTINGYSVADLPTLDSLEAAQDLGTITIDLVTGAVTLPS